LTAKCHHFSDVSNQSFAFSSDPTELWDILSVDALIPVHQAQVAESLEEPLRIEQNEQAYRNLSDVSNQSFAFSSDPTELWE
jgi:hypothetical protein